MSRTPRTKAHPNARWKLDHDPEALPLGCNGLYGKSGYNKHKYHGTEPCEACKESKRHYERERDRGQNYPRKLKPCGTPAAAKRHRYNKEPLDIACRLAEQRERNEIRDRKRRAKLAASTDNQ